MKLVNAIWAVNLKRNYKQQSVFLIQHAPQPYQCTQGSCHTEQILLYSSRHSTFPSVVYIHSGPPLPTTPSLQAPSATQ